MDRPTKEVTLPTSGIKLNIFTYYLRGERKEIESIMLDSAEFEQDEAGTPRLKKVDASYRSKMEDKAVLLAIKDIVGKSGAKIEKTVEVLDGLPADDFDVLQGSLPGAKPKKK